LLVSSLSKSFAQTSLTPSSPWGTWFIGTVQLPGGDKKWGGFAEVQARGNAVFHQFFYRELKAGVSYDISEHLRLRWPAVTTRPPISRTFGRAVEYRKTTLAATRCESASIPFEV
jgi:hypothetical protein